MKSTMRLVCVLLVVCVLAAIFKVPFGSMKQVGFYPNQLTHESNPSAQSSVSSQSPNPVDHSLELKQKDLGLDNLKEGTISELPSDNSSTADFHQAEGSISDITPSVMDQDSSLNDQNPDEQNSGDIQSSLVNPLALDQKKPKQEVGELVEFPPLSEELDSNQSVNKELSRKSIGKPQNKLLAEESFDDQNKQKLKAQETSSGKSFSHTGKDPIIFPLPNVVIENQKTDLESHPFSDSGPPSNTGKQSQVDPVPETKKPEKKDTSSQLDLESKDPSQDLQLVNQNSNPNQIPKQQIQKQEVSTETKSANPTNLLNQELQEKSKTKKTEIVVQPVDWWKFRAAINQRQKAQIRTVGLDELVTSALQNSPRIKFLQQTPKIVQQDVVEADSVFDPLVEIETLYNDTVDPVGNTLTTGGEPFLEENTWSGTVGLRRRFRNGLESRIYQRLGFQNSNSTFFTPQDQGTATFGIDFTMPLLRDAGEEINQAPVVIAQLESGIAWDEYHVELQKELYEIATIYWTLYNSRIQVLLRQKNLKRAETILAKLKARSNYDTSPTQISQAQAEVSIRQSELQDALLSVREQEISLRERIGKKEFRQVHNVEVIPSDVPEDWYPVPEKNLSSWIDLALNQRYELKRDRARSKVSEQQIVLGKSGLAPKLDLIFGVSSSALEGDSGLGQAFTKQFGSTTPGFQVGVDYQLPYGRRAGRAQLSKARLQHRQRLESIEVQKNAIISEVARAFNFLEVSNRNYYAAYKATEDIRKSVVQLRQRWEEFAFLEGAVSQGATPSLALDRLLAGQRRLTEAETRLANAELNRVTARLRIALATGSLLQSIQGTPSFSIAPEAPKLDTDNLKKTKSDTKESIDYFIN